MILETWEKLRPSTEPAKTHSVEQLKAYSSMEQLPEARDVTSNLIISHHRRMSKVERSKQLVAATVKVITDKGFTGFTLQAVADEAGISEPALFHYVRTKNDLLGMVIAEVYDSPEADEYIYNTCKVTDYDGHDFWYFPRFCVNNVVFNLQRPELVKLFSIMSGDALAPNHPAHEYFISRHQKYWNQVSQLNWLLPEGYGLTKFYTLWELTMSAMDGLQLRWLSDGRVDMLQEWFNFSEELFGDEKWKGFLDPSEYSPESQECLLPKGILSRHKA
jgi:AcrR family transcriptional regulator